MNLNIDNCQCHHFVKQMQVLGHCLHFSCVNAALSSLSDKEKVTAKYVYSIAPQLLKNEGESVCFCPPGGAHIRDLFYRAFWCRYVTDISRQIWQARTCKLQTTFHAALKALREFAPDKFCQKFALFYGCISYPCICLGICIGTCPGICLGMPSYKYYTNKPKSSSMPILQKPFLASK